MGRRDVLKVTRAVWMGTTGKICTHLTHTPLKTTAALGKGHGMESGKLHRKFLKYLRCTLKYPKRCNIYLPCNMRCFQGSKHMMINCSFIHSHMQRMGEECAVKQEVSNLISQKNSFVLKKTPIKMQMSGIRATPNADGELARQDAGEDGIPVMRRTCHTYCDAHVWRGEMPRTILIVSYVEHI